MKTVNCLIAGIGGQGTVLASKLLASAAMKHGFNVRTTETIGMAQRGGSVVSHVRIGKEIFSPLIPLGGAHLLIGFDPAEAVRQLPYLAEEGTVIAAGGAAEMVEALRSNVSNTVIIPVQTIRENFAMMLNVALLGAAAQSGCLPFGADGLREAISEMPRFREENLNAFALGRSLYDENAG